MGGLETHQRSARHHFVRVDSLRSWKLGPARTRPWVGGNNGYIYRANPNKSPLNFLEKRERGRIQGLPIFVVSPSISGMGKAMDVKFCRNTHRVDRNKSPWKMLGIVAVGVVRESRKFSGHPYIGRIARSSFMIFAIAQLSCFRLIVSDNKYSWLPGVVYGVSYSFLPFFHIDKWSKLGYNYRKQNSTNIDTSPKRQFAGARQNMCQITLNVTTPVCVEGLRGDMPFCNPATTSPADCQLSVEMEGWLF